MERAESRIVLLRPGEPQQPVAGGQFCDRRRRILVAGERQELCLRRATAGLEQCVMPGRLAPADALAEFDQPGRREQRVIGQAMTKGKMCPIEPIGEERWRRLDDCRLGFLLQSRLALLSPGPMTANPYSAPFVRAR